MTRFVTSLAGNSGTKIRVPPDKYHIQKPSITAATPVTVSNAMIIGDDQAYALDPVSCREKMRDTEIATQRKHPTKSSWRHEICPTVEVRGQANKSSVIT